MDTSKVYHDVEGNECTIWQMVKREPEWAANVIQSHELTIDTLRSENAYLNDMIENAHNRSKLLEAKLQSLGSEI